MNSAQRIGTVDYEPAAITQPRVEEPSRIAGRRAAIAFACKRLAKDYAAAMNTNTANCLVTIAVTVV
jgi:hypothetical protein